MKYSDRFNNLTNEVVELIGRLASVVGSPSDNYYNEMFLDIESFNICVGTSSIGLINQNIAISSDNVGQFNLYTIDLEELCKIVDQYSEDVDFETVCGAVNYLIDELGDKKEDDIDEFNRLVSLITDKSNPDIADVKNALEELACEDEVKFSNIHKEITLRAVLFIPDEGFTL